MNAIVLFNTRYLDAAVAELRAGGYEAREDDAARLSPFVRGHINVLGRYSFLSRSSPGCGRCVTRPSQTRRKVPDTRALTAGVREHRDAGSLDGVAVPVLP